MEYIALLMGVITGIIMMSLCLSLPFNQKDKYELERKLKSSQGIKKKFLALIYVIDSHKGLTLSILFINQIFFLLGIYFATVMIIENTSIVDFLKEMSRVELILFLFVAGYLVSALSTGIVWGFSVVVLTFIDFIKNVKAFMKNIVTEYKKLTQERR